MSCGGIYVKKEKVASFACGVGVWFLSVRFQAKASLLCTLIFMLIVFTYDLIESSVVALNLRYCNEGQIKYSNVIISALLQKSCHEKQIFWRVV